MNAYLLKSDEKEFNINYNFADKFASVTITANPNDKLFKELVKKLIKYPTQYKLTSEEKDENGVTYYMNIHCPKDLAIKLATPREKRVLTEEQHQANIEKGKRLAALRKNKS